MPSNNNPTDARTLPEPSHGIFEDYQRELMRDRIPQVWQTDRTGKTWNKQRFERGYWRPLNLIEWIKRLRQMERITTIW